MIDFVPDVSDDVVKWADPALRFAVPNVVFPALKVTLPVGVPKLLVTAAVKVTAFPKFEGFRFELTAVDVGAGFTTWLSRGEVLAVKFTSLE